MPELMLESTALRELGVFTLSLSQLAFSVLVLQCDSVKFVSCVLSKEVPLLLLPVFPRGSSIAHAPAS